MRKNLLLLLCVSIPSFMINMDSNIVSVSLTSISQSFHADFSSIEWVISAYALAFATFVMPGGTLADRFGRKRLLITGLVIFTISSALCGLASDVEFLNWSRVLQGAGAALQLSAALAILSHHFVGKERAKAFAFFGSVIGIATMMGPVVGGLITQYLGWKWAFYVNLPIGTFVIVLATFALDESRDPDTHAIDWAGIITFSAFLGMLTYALISGNRIGWTSRHILASLCVAVISFALFIFNERRHPRPMVDLKYFRNPTYLGSSIVAVAYAASYLTMLTYLPFFFQAVLGHSPLVAGALMLPLCLPLFIVPKIVSSRLDHRLDGRTLLTIGLLLVGGGLLLTGSEIGRLDYRWIACTMLIASIGAGILNGQISKVGMSVIPKERSGMASGIAGSLRFSGVVLGFASLGAILTLRVHAGVAMLLQKASTDTQAAVSKAVASGHLGHAAVLASGNLAHAYDALAQCLASSYSTVMFAAGAFATVCAVLAWILITPARKPKQGNDRTQGGLSADRCGASLVS